MRSPPIVREQAGFSRGLSSLRAQLSVHICASARLADGSRPNIGLNSRRKSLAGLRPEHPVDEDYSGPRERSVTYLAVVTIVVGLVIVLYAAFLLQYD
jgi:hypothetical protein